MHTKPPFETLVDRHGAAVLRVCRAVVGPDDADDAWSETFLAALRAYPDLPAGANTEAWLVTIAHRKAIDIARSARRRAAVVGADADGAAPRPRVGDADAPAPRGAGDPELRLTRHAAQDAAHDAAREVWDHVRRLPDKQRRVIAYHYLAGLPYADIAGLVGGTPDAARRAAADGIKTLRARLADPVPRPMETTPGDTP